MHPTHLPFQFRLLHVRQLGQHSGVLLLPGQCQKTLKEDGVSRLGRRERDNLRVSRKAFRNLHADSRCARCLARVMSGACVLFMVWSLMLKLNEKFDLRKYPHKKKREKWIPYRDFKTSANPCKNSCVPWFVTKLVCQA